MGVPLRSAEQNIEVRVIEVLPLPRSSFLKQLPVGELMEVNSRYQVIPGSQLLWNQLINCTHHQVDERLLTTLTSLSELRSSGFLWQLQSAAFRIEERAKPRKKWPSPNESTRIQKD